MSELSKNVIGIIGGSGLYNFREIRNSKSIEINTPFGKPSEKIITGEIKGVKVAFISRHGIGHRLNPSEVNYRANMYALKTLGVNKLISSTAVGSLKEEIPPTHLVIPDQYIDNTYKREKTYFEDGMVAHVSMANPVCPFYSKIAYDISIETGLESHLGGIYYNMEGPQFSSKAESKFYRELGCSVIGMTQAIEAKLARELEICFIPIAFVTDYDCWHPDTENVTAEMVVKHLEKNISNSIKLILKLILAIDSSKSDCLCQQSLKGSILTNLDNLNSVVKNRMKLIIERYLIKEN